MKTHMTKARWSALLVGVIALTAAAFAQQQPAPGTPTVLANPPAREPSRTRAIRAFAELQLHHLDPVVDVAHQRDVVADRRDTRPELQQVVDAGAAVSRLKLVDPLLRQRDRLAVLAAHRMP